MPKLLHESTGLRIHENDKNGFAVVRLHYTADPAKRSEEWKHEAMAGMSPAKWAMEYEIDFTAQFGEKVFPEIITAREHIVVKEPHPEVGPTAPCWGGLDFGMRNPSSFHVYTLDDGVTYSIWELYEPCRNIPEFAAKMKACPYWSQIRYIAADPDMFNSKLVDKIGNPCSAAQLFLEAGITKLFRGNNDEQSWLALMRQAWANAEDPTFRIYDCCANQIREFSAATFVSMSERQMQTSNYREAIVDHDNHAMDDCKYFMNSRPKVVKRGVQLPNMARLWRH
jgi:hypothetical protein